MALHAVVDELVRYRAAAYGETREEASRQVQREIRALWRKVSINSGRGEVLLGG